MTAKAGLSKLQRIALALGLENRAERSPRGLPDAFHYEVLHAWRGWEYDPDRVGPHGSPYYGGNAFRRSEIPDYNAGTTALSLAISRLVGRGLVVKRSMGIALTDDGVVLAADHLEWKRLAISASGTGR